MSYYSDLDNDLGVDAEVAEHMREDEWMSADECPHEIAQRQYHEMSDGEIKGLVEVTIFKGKKVRQKFANFFSVENLIDEMQERAYDCIDECAEDYLNDVTDEQKGELGKLVIEWAAKHSIEPSFYLVEDIEEYTVPVSELPQTPEAE